MGIGIFEVLKILYCAGEGIDACADGCMRDKNVLQSDLIFAVKYLDFYIER